MNILFLAPDPPFPPTDGARLVVARLARALSQSHTLYLAALTDNEPMSPDLARYFAKTKLIPRPVTPKWQKWARSLFDDLPLWARVNVSPALAAAIRQLLSENAIDVVHLDTGLMATYLNAVASLPTVLAPHDSLTRVLAQRISRGAAGAQSLAARLQYGKMKRFETTQYARADRVVVVTAGEESYLQNLAPALPLRVIPNGIDTDYFAPMPSLEKPLHLGFHGVMDYPENVTAALNFARNVMPLIWNELPAATFTIIGRNPAPALLTLTSDKRIQVTGRVDDVRPWIAAQSLMVVPMLDAGGIKNKMLEALSMGRAVVATPQAAEGITARAGDDFALAQTPSELAAACRSLLREDSERARLGANARAWALNHTWEKTAAEYLTVYQEAIHAAALR